MARRSQQQKIEYIPLQGGLDTETPDLKVGIGRLKSSLNYEEDIEGGYVPVTGYEAFDGRTAPSSVTYSTLPVLVTGTVAVGDTVTGADSSETAVVIALDIAANNTGKLIVTKDSGAFNASEDLNVSGKQAETTATQTADGESNNQKHAQYKNLAADEYRGDVAVPTGSGSILGGFTLADTHYCIRNNAGATAADLWKATASGWSQIALGHELSFTSGGTYEIVEGDTITGATSGETAVVERIPTLTSGTWAGGDAAGKLILSARSGAFQSENLNVGANSNVATIAGDASAITLAASGKLDWDSGTFGNGVTPRVYGADGVSRGFEFDGSILVPIDTGMTTDTPAHCHVHQHHLFFSFTGGSVQNSGIGDPYTFSPVLGANEMVTEDEVTAFTHEPGEPGARDAAAGSLVVLCRNTTYFLYGTSTSDFNLVKYRQEVGGFAWSIQDVGKTMMMDDQGIRDIFTAQEFGNFAHSTLSDDIKKFINERKTKVVASCQVRAKNQYRIFFSDQYALFITMHLMGRRDPSDPLKDAMMPVRLSVVPSIAWSAELSDGSETVFFGATDGMVYQMEKGTSFNGEPISANCVTAYHHFGSPRVKKRWRGGMLEIDGDGYAELNFNYKLSYGDAVIVDQPAQQTKVVAFRAGKWDGGGTWDSGGSWDAEGVDKVELDVDGSAENISVELGQSSDYFSPIRITGVLLRQNPRRLRRG